MQNTDLQHEILAATAVERFTCNQSYEKLRIVFISQIGPVPTMCTGKAWGKELKASQKVMLLYMQWGQLSTCFRKNGQLHLSHRTKARLTVVSVCKMVHCEFTCAINNCKSNNNKINSQHSLFIESLRGNTHFFKQTFHKRRSTPNKRKHSLRLMSS